jgi:CAAX prenyl protease-like protein
MSKSPAWLPHVLPYALFLVLTWAGGQAALLGAPEDLGPLVAYPVKLVACAALVLVFLRRGSYPELGTGFRWAYAPLDVLVGVAVFLLWIAPESIPGLQMGESSFDPGAAGEGWRVPLVGVRLLGAVVLVPYVEELFIRSFLPRFVDTMDGERDWRDLPIGRFTLLSFAVTAVLFGLAHHRWAVGIATGVVYNAWLLWRRSLGHVILAHAVTNLALAVYVLETGRYTFW